MLPDPTPRQSTATSVVSMQVPDMPKPRPLQSILKRPSAYRLPPFGPFLSFSILGYQQWNQRMLGFPGKILPFFLRPPPRKPSSPSCQSGYPRSDPECHIPPAFCLIPSTQVYRVPYPQGHIVWSHSVFRPITHPCGARHFDLKMRLPWGCVQPPMPVRAHYLFICVTFFVAVI